MPSSSPLFLLASTVLLWSFVLAGVLYALRGFPAPFRASLTPEQVRIKKASARARGAFFWCAFGMSLVVVGSIAWVCTTQSRQPAF